MNQKQTNNFISFIIILIIFISMVMIFNRCSTKKMVIKKEYRDKAYKTGQVFIVDTIIKNEKVVDIYDYHDLFWDYRTYYKIELPVKKYKRKNINKSDTLYLKDVFKNKYIIVEKTN